MNVRLTGAVRFKDRMLEAGEVTTVPDEVGRRWIRRDLAVEELVRILPRSRKRAEPKASAVAVSDDSEQNQEPPATADTSADTVESGESR